MTAEHKLYPLGEPGQMATYQHESEGSLSNTVVKTLTVSIGSIEEKAGSNGKPLQHPVRKPKFFYSTVSLLCGHITV